VFSGFVAAAVYTGLWSKIFPKRKALAKAYYVPNEFIVKLKPGRGFKGLSIKTGLLKTGINSIDKKNKKFHISSGKRVFTGKEKTARDRRLAKKIGLDRIFLFKSSRDIDVESVVAAYEADPNVEYAEPNGIGWNQETIPNDTYFKDHQWGLKNYAPEVFPPWWEPPTYPKGRPRNDYSKNPPKEDADIDATDAWDTIHGSSSVVIAIVDTGIDLDHPDLASNIWQNSGETGTDANGNDKRYNGIDDDGNEYIDDYRGWDFVNNDNNPMDDHGHGTHVAGIAAAVTNNSKGVAGVCWNSKLMAVKAGNSGNSYKVADTAEAIEYAANNGAKIINMSFAFYSNFSTLYNAIKYAYNKGKVLIAAIGNLQNQDGSRTWYPAAYSEVLAVGATDTDDTRVSTGNNDSWSSIYGPHLDVVAPGNWIYSTKWNDTYDYLHGTSMATPFVSGLAGLVWNSSLFKLSRDEIYKRIRNGAEDQVGDEEDTKGRDNYYGYGRVNADKSIVHYSANPMLSPDSALTATLEHPTYGTTPGYYCSASFEAGSSTKTVELFICDAPAPEPPAGYQLAAHTVYYFGPKMNFLKPVKLTFSFFEEIEPETVEVFWYNEQAARWEKIEQGKVVNPTAHTITVETDHFSLIGAFSPSPAEVGYSPVWRLVTFLLLVGAGFYLLMLPARMSLKLPVLKRKNQDVTRGS
jgi:subtilisin family serine protease